MAAKPSTVHRVRRVVTGYTKPFDGLSVNPIHARRNFRANLLYRNPDLSLTLSRKIKIKIIPLRIYRMTATVFFLVKAAEASIQKEAV